ncbi:flagellar basal body-associated protein FliL [Psychromonas sp. psych-6C06]|uniref:flagellar basal body-associated protein FliL n=1 Tax=Psychromonas sp. psych-6C06 TaxID=2058089 RepID=UPI000C31EB98|nr:flagellar basal body-associated protein FliL [Psychromonas sp. psych-6C06]PKF62941.1 flagellar basal body-associated protein FliL [Psychromonas sp. psych-6C06]
MAGEENEELSLDEGATAGGGKKKLIIIIVAVVLLLGGGAAAYFLLFSGDSAEASADQTSEQQTSSEVEGENSGAASYVAMPRPFVFNVMDGKRDRLVQIKVQLLVRGTTNETLAKKHIPLLEGTLVRIFGAATVGQLRSPEGKDQLREYALKALNESTKKLEGKELIDTVLFTGFVLQ